jgi:hypothetical protein
MRRKTRAGAAVPCPYVAFTGLKKSQSGKASGSPSSPRLPAGILPQGPALGAANMLGERALEHLPHGQVRSRQGFQERSLGDTTTQDRRLPAALPVGHDKQMNQLATRVVDFVGRLQGAHVHTGHHAYVRERGSKHYTNQLFQAYYSKPTFQALGDTT